ncbi:nucleoside-diphosphate-sugar epimerase-like protein [Phanerochaete sordida]|uniref:Nucleoside-diphosphate-sugar epimerase-like protein n=1 Tax=Phanerochaete sordida TaxID=48140 RepID=A0A9P3G3I2_9APHY|nr:nucleoside-diphosphate-sugar epimerase-like protein [Phanerochaete sordida]
MSGKPTAIIFGGLNTCSRALAAFLVPLDGEPLVSHLRIVDKYSVNPPTTYLGAEFPQVLEKGIVEYKQANLTIPSTVTSCFDPPAGQEAYSYVFDLTGEIQWDRPEQVQIKTTFNVARLVGLEAAKRKVQAYVRLQHPFYECKEKGSHDEKEDVKPDGVLGTWWHETLRMLASIEDLNLVVLRSAMVYGPYVDYGVVMCFIAVASTYGYIKQPMKALWGPGKHPTHTVHVEDVAGGMWACAEWMSKIGRKEANSIAGEEILFKNDKSKVKEVEGMVAPDQKCVAPAFNIEDDSNTSMADLGNIITSFFGTTFEFHNFLTNMLANWKLEENVEEINESHVSNWTEMIQKSNPPVSKLHYTAYMDLYHLKKHVVAFNATKLKEVVGYKLRRPQINHDTLREVIDKLKAEGSWPNLQGSS